MTITFSSLVEIIPIIYYLLGIISLLVSITYYSWKFLKSGFPLEIEIQPDQINLIPLQRDRRVWTNIEEADIIIENQSRSPVHFNIEGGELSKSPNGSYCVEIAGEKTDMRINNKKVALDQRNSFIRLMLENANSLNIERDQSLLLRLYRYGVRFSIQNPEKLGSKKSLRITVTLTFKVKRKKKRKNIKFTFLSE